MRGASQQKSSALQIKGSPPSAKRFNKRVLGTLLGGSSLAILLAAGFALRSPDSKAVAPQELYNTTSKALPDALNALPQSYSEVEPSPQFGILGPPLPGDIGAGLYGKPKDIPTDNPFRYQPPSSYTPAPAQRYGGTGPQASSSAPTGRTSNLFFIAKDGGGDSAKAAQASAPTFADPGVAALAALLALAAWLSWPTSPTRLSYANQFAQLVEAAPADLVRLPWQWKPDDSQWVAGGSAIRGEVLWSSEQQRGFMRLRNAPTNAAGRQYQLWIFDERPASGQHPVDGGVFDVLPTGRDAVDGPDLYVPIRAKIPVQGRPKFAITVEDEGGVVVSKREQILVAAGLF